MWRNRKLSAAEKAIGLIGLGCAVVGLALLISDREKR